MFALNPSTTLTLNLSGHNTAFCCRGQSPSIAGAFTGSRRKIRIRSRVSQNVSNHNIFQAVIGRGGKAADITAMSAADRTRSPLSGGEGIQVRAVVSIRKKMKENINEKLEDQWEWLVNGFGLGIQMQLISEEMDPG